MPAYSGMWTLSQVAQAIKNNDWTGVPPTVVEYLVVAGGGGGGWTGFSSGSGGGGGAGGLLQGYAGITPGTSYYVTVGAGGTSTTSSNSSGGNSVFDATGSGASTGRIVATGGGGGGAGNTSSGANGGSGGGGAYSTAGSIAGAGITGQGNPGGIGAVNASPYNGGGGGGAGTTGLPTTASTGGAGIASDIVGSKVVYAGGGGGGSQTTAGVGGVGGGGSGGTANVAGVSATPNTGGGGGGAGNSGVGSLAGGNGGSGIVVIRYPGNVQYFTGGTLSYSNGFMVHTFYSSGTLAPTTPRLFASPDYQIARSLRFNSADSANLTRTLTTATVRNRWTWSGWVKRSVLDSGAFQTLFSSSDGAIGNDFFGFNQAVFRLAMFGGTYVLQSNVQYRDPAAWYHVVVAVDTTQSTDTDRAKVYINGVQITAWGTAGYPPQNYSCSINGAYAHQIGSILSSSYSSMMLTEVNFIDGQQLTPGSFGYLEPSTGVWTPLQYTGSYGTNGFYLNFADNSNTTAATLGKDYSGNGNNWTPNNFSVTAGVDNDSFVDSPTNYGTDTGAGGEVRGNYCTLNPLDNQLVLSNGNLQFNRAVALWVSSRATFGMTSGKWYWEVTATAATGTLYCMVGVALNSVSLNDYFGASSNGFGYSAHDGYKYSNGGFAYGSSWVVNDVIGIAFDADAGTITFYKNNVSQGVAFTGLTSGPYFPAVGLNGTVTAFINFGQRAFAHTAPSGFKALCTQNFPESAIGKLPSNYFSAVTYTGTGATRPVYVGFQPDLVWSKSRNNSTNHEIYDVVRGIGSTSYALFSNLTNAETASTGNRVSAVNSDGFQIAGNAPNLNASTYTYVAWNWKAGGTAVTNTAGSITSTVSANPSAGFSIVTYTGTGANATVGHGLGVAPRMIIVKCRNGVTNWPVYHASLSGGANDYLILDATNAKATNVVVWNNTSPTSTVFSVGTDTFINGASNTYVSYCWTEVPGYSKFGSYVGNGSTDGPFVYCGFRPNFVMTKRSSVASNWAIHDNARDAYNPETKFLFPNSSSAEVDNSVYAVDLVSNGFKIRGTGAEINQNSGDIYIFAAFAESPLKYSRGR